MPTVTSDPTPKKILVACANSKTGMYECIVHKDHVTCNCQCFKYNSLCKHSLCVAQTVDKLKQHVDYVVVRLSTSRILGVRSDSASAVQPFTKIHHNNQPLKVCFLTDEVKAISCKQCGKEFPRRKNVIPFDIVLSHEEKWMYPDANNPGEKLPSSKYTTKFYCVDSRCIKARFPYFEPKLYLETKLVEQRLKESHIKPWSNGPASSRKWTQVEPQASQTHDSTNRSNIYDLSTRIEWDVTALCVRCCVTHWTVERSIYKALYGI